MSGTKSTTYYMHTLDDQPASFDGKDYIYFAGGNAPVILVESLRQIRREQQKEIARYNRDYSPERGRGIMERLGYAKVRMPR